MSYFALENALEDHAEGKAPISREEARRLLEELRRLRRAEDERDSARDEIRCRIRGLNFVEVVRDALRGKGYPAFGAP